MASSTDTWFALYVKSRHEKSVQKILDYKGYRTSVPVRKSYRTRSAGSVWESEKPLIPGYVFVGHNPERPHHIVTTPGVVQMLGYGHDGCAIPYCEIEAMERIASSEFPVGNCEYTRIGDAVELVRGPLKGLCGKVVRQSGSTRLVVSIDLLQRSLFVEIENTWAAPANWYAQL